MNLTLPVSGAWRTTAIDLGQWLPGGSADGRNRRTPAPNRAINECEELPQNGHSRPSQRSSCSNEGRPSPCRLWFQLLTPTALSAAWLRSLVWVINARLSGDRAAFA